MTSYPSSKTYSTEIEKTQNIIVSIEEMMWGGRGGMTWISYNYKDYIHVFYPSFYTNITKDFLPS